MRQRYLDAWVLPTVALLTLAVDQASKFFVATRLAEGQSWAPAPWLAPLFSITHVTNTGTAFGLFPALGNLFVVVAVVVIGAIILYYRHLPAGQWLLRAALGLQLGGAVGNLVDRLHRGFVVDFIDLNFWPLHEWPVFNLADASIVAGVAILAVTMLWEGRSKEAREEHG